MSQHQQDQAARPDRQTPGEAIIQYGHSSGETNIIVCNKHATGSGEGIEIRLPQYLSAGYANGSEGAVDASQSWESTRFRADVEGTAATSSWQSTTLMAKNDGNNSGGGGGNEATVGYSDEHNGSDIGYIAECSLEISRSTDAIRSNTTVRHSNTGSADYIFLQTDQPVYDHDTFFQEVIKVDSTQAPMVGLLRKGVDVLGREWVPLSNFVNGNMTSHDLALLAEQGGRRLPDPVFTGVAAILASGFRSVAALKLEGWMTADDGGGISGSGGVARRRALSQISEEAVGAVRWLGSIATTATFNAGHNDFSQNECCDRNDSGGMATSCSYENDHHHDYYDDDRNSGDEVTSTTVSTTTATTRDPTKMEDAFLAASQAVAVAASISSSSSSSSAAAAPPSPLPLPPLLAPPPPAMSSYTYFEIPELRREAFFVQLRDNDALKHYPDILYPCPVKPKLGQVYTYVTALRTVLKRGNLRSRQEDNKTLSQKELLDCLQLHATTFGAWSTVVNTLESGNFKLKYQGEVDWEAAVTQAGTVTYIQAKDKSNKEDGKVEVTDVMDKQKKRLVHPWEVFEQKRSKRSS